MKTKTCTKCGIEKPLDAEHFYRQKNHKGEPGFHSHCKECRSKSLKEWRSRPEVREKQLENSKRWNENNKERVREKNRKWYEENLEKVKERDKQRYHNNKEYFRNNYKKWFEKNRQHRYDYAKQRRKDNLEVIREKERNQQKKWKAKLEAGVYVITCEKNNKKYIGQSQILRVRITDHFSRLKANKHEKQEIQNDFNKYGEENFSYEVYETLCKDKAVLEKRESEIIKEFIERGYKLYNVKQ